MTTKQAGKHAAPDAAATPEAPAVSIDDPRDAEIAELRRQLEEAHAAKADVVPAPAAPEDARDATIAKLREELEGIRSTPEGASAELMRALAALSAKVDAMASGQGLIPVPQGDRPDPFLYGAVLATGEVVWAQHPQATHHYSPAQKITVPITGHFLLDPETRALANASV